MNRLIKLLICFSVNVPRKLLLHAKSEKILGCTLGISCVLYSDASGVELYVFLPLSVISKMFV